MKKPSSKLAMKDSKKGNLLTNKSKGNLNTTTVRKLK